MPGGDFVITRRQLQLEGSALFGNSVERVIKHTYEGAHPLVNVASDRYWWIIFGIRELRVGDQIWRGLRNIELRILLGPDMDVVERRIAILYLQRLIRHHRERMRNVVAILLIDLNWSCGSCVAHPGRQAGTNVYDHVLQSPITDLHGFGRWVIRRVHLAIRIGSHLYLIVWRRRSLKGDFSSDRPSGFRHIKRVGGCGFISRRDFRRPSSSAASGNQRCDTKECAEHENSFMHV